MFEQELGYSSGIRSYGFGRLIAVRQMGGIAKINNVFSGQNLFNCMGNGQSAYTRIENSYWIVVHLQELKPHPLDADEV